jgi:FKBP-type peptidyl-prolyl cis-trans isomerase 2
MVEKGSIVRVEYDAWADGELFDTTSAETAKQHNKYREEAYYGPLPIIVGARRVVPGFDAALLQAPVGEEREVEIPPEQAFGARDPAKLDTFSVREFLKREVEPEPGMRIEWEGKGRGTIVSVTAGRVRVDFNPPLAGKAVRYKFKVLEELAQPEARVRAILDNDYGYGRSDGFGVKVEGEQVELTLPDSCKFDPRWPAMKYVIVADLRRYAGMTKIRLVEEYEPPEPQPEPEPQEPAEEELTDEDRKQVAKEISRQRKRGG